MARPQQPRRSKRIAASRESSIAHSREGSRAPSPVANSPVATSLHIDNAALRLLAMSSPRKSPTPPAQISPVTVTAAIDTPRPVENTPRPNLLRRAFGFLSSPFGTLVRPTLHNAAPSSSLHMQYDAPQPSTPTPQQPLGELPASRKRPAPEISPERESQRESQPREPAPIAQQAPQKPAIALVSATPTRLKTPRGPSTLNRNARSSLNAISERTENSSTTSAATIRAAEPTPSRNRTITSVRSKREQAARNTPSRPRAWVQPPMPREPNADSRLAKLNHYNEIKEQMKSLEKDEEIREMTAGHRTKRVKIDDLVYIPHNRPGDPSGTFRVYDDDSDDEMEVDEDVELRKNVFEEIIEDPSPPKKQERPKQTELKQYEPPKQSQLPQMKAAPSPGELLQAQMEAGTPLEPHQLQVPEDGRWVFPSVGERKEPYQEGTAQEARLGAIFKMAYDHWTRSGEILPVF